MLNSSTLAIVLVLYLVIVAALYVWVALSLSAVFRKAGFESWRAWVPVFNIASLLQLGGLSPWLVLLGLVPVFGWLFLWVVVVVAAHRVNQGFGLGSGLTVLAALLFPVWATVVGFGSARWIAGPVAGPVRSSLRAPARVSSPMDAAAPPSSAAPLPSPADLAVADDAARPASTGAAPAAPLPSAAATAASAPTSAAAAAAPAAWTPPTTPPAAPASSVPAVAETPWQAPAAPSPPPGSSIFADLWPEEDSERFDRPTSESPAPASAAPTPPAEVPVDANGFPARPVFGDGRDEIDELSAGISFRSVPSAPVSSVPPADRGDALVPPMRSDEPVADNETVDLSDAASGARRASAAVDDPASPVPWRAPEATGGLSDTTDAPSLTRSPARGAWQPPIVDPVFPEITGEVSAVAGAPVAGVPRSAAGAVSAQWHAEDDLEDGADATVIARRRKVRWSLATARNASVELTADVVIVGRRPAADPAHPGAQLVPLSDDTRTVSKTHALLRLQGDRWYITDLHSTNGVLFSTVMGTDVEIEPGVEAEAGDRFFLGDVEVRLNRVEG
jgi:hypothetical protein